MARLTFHGAAGTVTGSRFLLEAERGQVLVDCGMFQGRKELRQRNWRAPGFEPRAVDAVVLTHAHIDHSGWLPRLVRAGFRGPILATPATADLTELLLEDSARIQEEDAAYANEKGHTRHRPALPLYTVADARSAVRQIEVVDFGAENEPVPGVRFAFRNAGHIVGSGWVDLRLAEGERRLLFSGDVGRYDAPLVPDPTRPTRCDVLIVESTYGDRDHPTADVAEQLADLLAAVRESAGTLLVAAFAVGRAQQLVWLLRQVMARRPELEMAIHLDSPMAVDATRIYRKYALEGDLDRIEMLPGNRGLFGRGVFLHRSREDSIRLNGLDGPRVLISSSGMMTGGRVLHHLRRLLPEPRNVVVLAGYQAPGTRGWRLRRGELTLRIHGRDVPVRARREEISGLSAHADRSQLLRWLSELPPPAATYVVHGDEGASEALAGLLADRLGHACVVPRLGQTVEV